MVMVLLGFLWLHFVPAEMSYAIKPPPSSAADQAALEKLDGMVLRVANRDSAEPVSPAVFEHAFPRTQMARWKRLQRHYSPSTEYGLDIAFLLAYYRVDYSQNIGRLLWPYKMWLYAREWPEQRYEKLIKKLDVDENTGWAVLSDKAAGCLTTLYDSRRDIHALQLACRMWLTGGPKEGQDGIIADVWLHHPKDLMRAAAGEINSQRNIAEVLVASDGMEPELPPPAKILARLHKLEHSHDLRVAAGARGVLKAALAFLHPKK